MVPDENSMEDPLCNSSFGSMVSLDYVTPDTGYEPKDMELADTNERNLATSSDVYFQNTLEDTASFPNPDIDDDELAEFLAVVVDRTGQPVEVRSNSDHFSCGVRNVKSAQIQFPLVTQPKRMIDQTGGSVEERIAEERESSNAQIRTLLNEQRRTIIAEYGEKVLHHEFLAAQAEQNRRILQEELLRQQQDFREVHQQDLMKMKELQKFQNSTFDEFTKQKFIEDQKIIMKLSGRLQELQNKVNCMNDSKDFQDAESIRSGNSYVTSPPGLFPKHPPFEGMPKPAFISQRQTEEPPNIWDTSGISGNVFAHPQTSSSAPYPQGLNSTWKKTIEEPIHMSTAEKSGRPERDQDLRCQSGPSAKDSVIFSGGDYSKNYGADQQRLQISDLHFDKFPTPATFACWKIRFKTEVCNCSQFPTEAMQWIKEVELVDSVDELRSSSSTRGISMPNFEVLDARIASALNKIIHNSHFKRKISLEEQKAQKEDRFLRGRQIAYLIYEYFRVTGANDSVENYTDLFTIVLRNDDIQEFDSKWDGILLSMTKIQSDVGVYAEPPSTHSPLFPCLRSKRPLCAHSKRPRVYRHHSRKCYHMRAWCRYTRGRFECTHGGFQRATPHHTHTPRPQRHTHTHDTTTTTTTTHGDRDRQGQGQRETEKERDKRRRDKTRRQEKKAGEETRQEKRREKRQERR